MLVHVDPANYFLIKMIKIIHRRKESLFNNDKIVSIYAEEWN